MCSVQPSAATLVPMYSFWTTLHTHEQHHARRTATQPSLMFESTEGELFAHHAHMWHCCCMTVSQDDFDIGAEEEASLDVKDRPEVQEKLERRIRSVEVKIITPPRPGVVLVYVLPTVHHTTAQHTMCVETLSAQRSSRHRDKCCQPAPRVSAPADYACACTTTRSSDNPVVLLCLTVDASACANDALAIVWVCLPSGKKCLVLDIDYTLFDLNSSAEHPDELARPYLHEFLTACYEYYDIIIWSATNMKWVEVRMLFVGQAGFGWWRWGPASLGTVASYCKLPVAGLWSILWCCKGEQ